MTSQTPFCLDRSPRRLCSIALVAACAWVTVLGCQQPTPDELPRIQADLKSAVMDTRYGAVVELGAMTDRSAEVVPLLVEALRDRDPVVREAAAYRLGGFASGAAPAISHLATTLAKDRDPDVRTAAAYALSDLGPVATPAVPALRAATRDRNPETRIEAVQALQRIQLAAKFSGASAPPEGQGP